jgi:hypothetical protein
MDPRVTVLGAAWLATMRSPAAPLRVRKHGALVDPLLDEHVRAAAADPELFALAAITVGATVEQQTRTLFALLASPRSALGASADRVIALLLDRLPAGAVIGVFLALRKQRKNHKHTARAIVRWVLQHPQAEALIARRRPALLDALEHALGRDVARACLKHVTTRTPEGDAYLARTVHRIARGDVQRTEWCLLALAQPARERNVAIATQPDAPATEAGPEVPKTVTATNRGDVAATLVHLYRGGDSAMLQRGLADYIDRAAARLPTFEGHVALVIDASLSTLGYGERQFCCISQSWALRLVLAKRCAKLSVHLVGGRGEPPHPEGATDLVMPLLDALAGDPDIVAIVTDGYENRLGGELARVLEALPATGVTTPVIVVNSKFTHKDDLALRSPAPAAPATDMWHENDFAVVLETIGSAARGSTGRAFLQRALGERLGALEKTHPSWMLHSQTSR